MYVMHLSLAESKLYFCDWEGRRKGQEWGKCCKGTLSGTLSDGLGEAKVKLGLSKIKLQLPSLKCIVIIIITTDKPKIMWNNS